MKKNLNNTVSVSSVCAEIMSEMLDSYFAECICHFNKLCMRKRKDETTRYFFSMKEVNYVKNNLQNPDSVTVKPLYDNGSIWCYEMDYAQVVKEKRGGKAIIKT